MMLDDTRLSLYAWVEHDHVDALILKHVHGGDLLVSARLDAIDKPGIERQLQIQANASGDDIRLVHLVEVDTIRILRPRGPGY